MPPPDAGLFLGWDPVISLRAVQHLIYVRRPVAPRAPTEACCRKSAIYFFVWINKYTEEACCRKSAIYFFVWIIKYTEEGPVSVMVLLKTSIVKILG